MALPLNLLIALCLYERNRLFAVRLTSVIKEQLRSILNKFPIPNENAKIEAHVVIPYLSFVLIHCTLQLLMI